MVTLLNSLFCIVNFVFLPNYRIRYDYMFKRFQHFNKMETNLPNNNNYEIKVKHTNSKYCRFCIRHEIPKLIKDNYLPGKVLEKINTHSYSGFVHYAQNYIISEYESMCCIRNCYI